MERQTTGFSQPSTINHQPFLGLVVALPEEARAITRVMRDARRESAGLVTGSMGERRVMLAWAGAGASGATRAADALLQRGAGLLMAVGFAGALAPALRPGHLLAATEVAEREGARWRADAGLLEALAGVPASRGPSMRLASAAAPLHRGTLLSASRVVATAAEKQQLREETGAVAVDMESAAVARCAARAGVPMMAIRAITDGADESLPLDFDLCFDSDGQFHRARLIRLLAHRPRSVGGLLRLGRHSAQAGRALGSFLVRSLSRTTAR